MTLKNSSFPDYYRKEKEIARKYLLEKTENNLGFNSCQ